MQIIAWITSIVLMLFVAGVFAWVVLKSREREEYEPIIKKWYKTRRFYGISLVLIMLIVTIFTLRELPYNEPAYGENEQATVVDVEAVQFAWEMSDGSLKWESLSNSM